MKNPTSCPSVRRSDPIGRGVLMAICILLLSSCVLNKRVLKEVISLRHVVVRLDSSYRSTQINIYRYEKNRIDSTRYDRLPDDELINRAKSAIKNNRR